MDTLLCNDDGDIVLGTYQPSNTLLSLSADAYTPGGATWSDQSGNGLNFTVSTNTSLKGTDADGFPYLNFSGSYGIAKRIVGSALTNIPAPTTGKYTIFSVTQILSTSAGRTLVRGVTTDHPVYVQSGNNNLGLYDNSGSNFVDSGFDVTTDMTSTRNLLVWELSTTAPIYKFQLNESGTDSTINSATTYTLPFCCIGGYHENSTNPATSSQYWGNIYEFIVYDGVLSASERAYVAEYLAYKWAITQKLPASFTNTHEVLTNQETLAFLYAGSGTETTYTWDARGVTYADVLVVGGGGGGSCSGTGGGGGGGGAGGVIIDTVSLGEDSYTITVGAGGNGAIGDQVAGTAGKNSTAFGLTAIGGGAGNTGTGGADINGGSGGGSGASSVGVQLFGTGVSGQGNNGGTGVDSGTRAGGGGGGAGGVGGNGSSGSGGIGGVGIESRISGIATYYAGGGAGATTNNTTISAGGNGGGGATFANGTDGLGGGGGAGYANITASGAGGSGIVLIKPNPGALDGLGPSVYTQAVGAYALRRLFGAYTGAQIRLRRSTDDAEVDVTFDKYGNVENFDLGEWLGGATGYVVTWYDQGPSAKHTTGYGTTLPSIYQREDGLYAVYFPGTSTTEGGYFNAGSVTLNVATNGGVSTFSRVNLLGANSYERVYDYGNTLRDDNLLLFRSVTTNSLVFQMYEGVGTERDDITVSNGIVNNTWQSFGNRIQGSGSSWIFSSRIDGTENTSAISRTYTDRTIINTLIGRSNWSNDSYSNMYLSCQIFFNTGSITSRQFAVMENTLY